MPVRSITDRELVSSNIVGSVDPALVDPHSTMTLGARVVKALAWFGNERGCARCIADLTQQVVQRTYAGAEA